MFAQGINGGNFHHNNATHTSSLFHTMKTSADIKGLEKLNLTAVVSCACSVLYFVVSNLLA